MPSTAPATSPTSRVSLGTALNGHDNALNCVRLVLACSVVIAHSFPLTGVEDPTGGLLTGLGELAVDGFFILSGYLIAASRLRLNVGAYLWRRILRIMPAFWVMLLMTGFVFAPLSTLFDGGSWSPGAGLAFVVANFFLKMNDYGVAGTLANVPFPEVWNGSAWSLFFEFGAYLLLGALFLVPWVRRHALPVCAGLLALIVVVQPLAHGPLEVTTNMYLLALRLGAFFLTGTVLYLVRDRIPVHAGIALACGAVLVVLYVTGFSTWFGQLPLVYVLLYAGATLKTRIGARNDLSYGMYIYAFPMQQFAYLMAGASWGWLGHSVLALALTVPLAAASWFWLEKPAMRLKSLVRSRRAVPSAEPVAPPRPESQPERPEPEPEQV